MPAHRPPAPRRVIAPLAALVACTAVAGYLVTAGPQARAGAGRPRGPEQVAATLDGAPPGADPVNPSARASTPGGAHATGPATPVAASRRYRFLLMQPDGVTPIRWNPCRPVHYRIARNGWVPATETRFVTQAFDAVGEALGGVTFVDDGPTTVVPDTVEDASRAGTDLVVAFAVPGSGPQRSDLLTGWEAGRGGFAASGLPGPDGTVVEHPTHGSVVIDGEKWRDMTRHERAVLYLHEIGHAVGLDHPADGDQIMSSGAYDLPARFQAGDRAALARLGRQAGCTS